MDLRIRWADDEKHGDTNGRIVRVRLTGISNRHPNIGRPCRPILGFYPHEHIIEIIIINDYLMPYNYILCIMFIANKHTQVYK
jgi:hypothetical protein